jgi:hypothetical protein
VFALALACAHFFRFGIVGTTIVIALLQIPVWLIINWREEVAIEITNKEIMLFLRDMFEFVKVSNRKIDHNRLIKQVRGTSK